MGLALGMLGMAIVAVADLFFLSVAFVVIRRAATRSPGARDIAPLIAGLIGHAVWPLLILTAYAAAKNQYVVIFQTFQRMLIERLFSFIGTYQVILNAMVDTLFNIGVFASIYIVTRHVARRGLPRA